MKSKKKVLNAEDTAREYRRLLGVDELYWLDPMTILMKLKRLIQDFNFALVESGEIAPALAKWDSARNLIVIGRETFFAANGQRAQGRARFAIFHEVMHALGGDEGKFDKLQSRIEIPRYAMKLRELESDVDRITAAFMAPRHLVQESWSADSIQFFFGVSAKTAKIRIEEIRGRTVPAKTLPDSVRQLLLNLDRDRPH